MTNLSELKDLKEILAKEFEIKDLDKLRNLLSMETARSFSRIFFSQRIHPGIT